MALLQSSGKSGQYHATGIAIKIPGIEPGRKHLAVHEGELALKPDIQILQRHCRSLLLRLEPTYRSALENNVNRVTRLGLSMIIFAGLYKPS